MVIASTNFKRPLNSAPLLREEPRVYLHDAAANHANAATVNANANDNAIAIANANARCQEIAETRSLVSEADNDSDAPPAKRFSKDVAVLRVQCKARGLSHSHNNQTAYLEIPLDAPHGSLLSCSHPQCQMTGGSRFRFCKVCSVPVAKRNFLRRHGHGLVVSTQYLKEEVDTVVVVTNSSATNTYASLTFPIQSMSRETVHPSKVPSSSSSHPETNPLTGEELEWLLLLRRRPGGFDEKAKMTRWMDEVLTFSQADGKYDSATESAHRSLNQKPLLPTPSKQAPAPPHSLMNSFFDVYENKRTTATDLPGFGGTHSSSNSFDTLIGNDATWFPSDWR